MNRKQQVKKSILYRGTYLDRLAPLELALNMYLAYHFCGTNYPKVIDMQMLIFGDERMSISNKIQVFYYVGTHYDKKWFDKYNGTFGNMNKDLNVIIENRNVFAHRLLEIDRDAIKAKSIENIKYWRFKNDLDIHEYTDEKFNTLLKTIDKLLVYFLDRNERTMFNLDEDGEELPD